MTNNPNVRPGSYNPSQSQTEGFDFKEYMGDGYVDPTQIPMSVGDTFSVPQSKALPLNPTSAPTPEYWNRATVEAAYYAEEPQSQSYKTEKRHLEPVRQIGAGREDRGGLIEIPICITITVRVKVEGQP